MTNALPLLKAVRARLADVNHWTRFAMARDALGRVCLSRDADAVCWCLSGAAAKHGLWQEEYLARALGFSSAQKMADWNDHTDRTHADIIARLDEAIEREETNV